MKILFCAYRYWADYVFSDLSFWEKRKSFITQLEYVSEPKEMERLSRSQHWDVIILVGWSWKVPEDIVNSTLVIGMHPSDLPKYAGGSPIQNQILDGLEESKATLFRLNAQFDKGEIIDKETIYLQGHLEDVFRSISIATTQLLYRFIETYPNYTLTPQNHKEGFVKRRLKPENSELPMIENSPQGVPWTCKDMWNFIRCREDPYPNAYFEDDTGKLMIKLVEFIPNDTKR